MSFLYFKLETLIWGVRAVMLPNLEGYLRDTDI